MQNFTRLLTWMIVYICLCILTRQGQHDAHSRFAFWNAGCMVVAVLLVEFVEWLVIRWLYPSRRFLRKLRNGEARHG